MTKLLCGIDGGGTRTTIVVTDGNGKLVTSFTEMSINHYGVGMERAHETCHSISKKLVDNLGRLPDAIYIGSSALEGAATNEEALRITGGAFASARLRVHSDVWIALLGFTMGKSGAILISGTGSMACGIDREGKYHTSGGWGHTLGDEGSGYHLGLTGIQAALRGYDGITGSTVLTESLKSHFNLTTLSKLIDLAYNPPIEKSRIASFAVPVEQAALIGDPVAIKLLEEEIGWLYLLALSISKKCGTRNLGMVGSMLTRSPVIGQRLKEMLGPDGIIAQYPQYKPEVGALFGAFELMGISLTEDIIFNLRNHDDFDKNHNQV